MNIKDNIIRLTFMTVVAMGTAFTTSCSDDDIKYQMPTLAVAESNVEFGAQGGSGKIIVTGMQGSISAKANADWVSLRQTNDSTFTVNVPAYTDYNNRQAVVTITDGNSETHVAVMQQGGIWAVTTTKYLASNQGGNITIPISTNLDYSYELPSWMKAEKTASGMVVTVAGNTSGKPRSGNVTLKTVRGETDVQILQFDAADLCGTYDASYSKYDWNMEFSSSKKAVVTIEQKPDVNNTFLVKGLSSDSTIAYVLKLDQSNGSLYFEMNDALGTIQNAGKTEYCYQKLFSTSANMISTESTLRYIAPVEMVNGNISLTFSDEIGFTYRSFYGAETGYVNAIATYRFSSNTYDTSSDAAISYLEILSKLILVKQ